MSLSSNNPVMLYCFRIAVHLALLFGLGSSNTYAHNDDSMFSLKGFGTIAVTGTDTNAIGFRRDITTEHGATKSWSIPTDSRLGLQLDARFDDQFSGTLQWVLKDKEGDFFEQNLEMAFLRWRISPDWSARIGRISADLFILSDHRNVNFAYPWMRPPHEVYAFNPVYHWDGIEIQKKLSIADGLLAIKLFGGYTKQQTNQSEFSGPIFNASAVYEKGNWKGRISYSQTDIANFSQPSLDLLTSSLSNPALNKIWPNIQSVIPLFKLTDNTLRYGAIGLVYDDGTWLGQAEASYVDTGNHHLFPNNGSGYMSLGRRISKFTLYSLLGISKSFGEPYTVPSPLLPDPRLIATQQAVCTALNNNSIDEKSVSIGLRWDFYNNMAFKVQWSHYWLGNNGTKSWVENSLQTPPNEVNVLSTGIDFVFK